MVLPIKNRISRRKQNRKKKVDAVKNFGSKILPLIFVLIVVAAEYRDAQRQRAELEEEEAAYGQEQDETFPLPPGYDPSRIPVDSLPKGLRDKIQADKIPLHAGNDKLRELWLAEVKQRWKGDYWKDPELDSLIGFWGILHQSSVWVGKGLAMDALPEGVLAMEVKDPDPVGLEIALLVGMFSTAGPAGDVPLWLQRDAVASSEYERWMELALARTDLLNGHPSDPNKAGMAEIPLVLELLRLRSQGKPLPSRWEEFRPQVAAIGKAYSDRLTLTSDGTGVTLAKGKGRSIRIDNKG